MSARSSRTAPRGPSANPGASNNASPLRVLQVSVHHPELVRGGAQRVCYDLFEGLKARDGIEPFLLAGVDNAMPALFRTGARITGFDGRPAEYLLLTRDFDYFWHRTANPLLDESYAEFLQQVRPDVVHFHHFLNIGVDLLTLTRRVLPHSRIVFTFHEFLAICTANGHMVRPPDGSLCTRDSPVRCHQCFPEIGPEMFFVRKQWFQRHLLAADVFTVPTRFMVSRYTDWGLPAERIVHVPNGQDFAPAAAPFGGSQSARNRFGFFGQLIDSKGVAVLLRAVTLLRAQGFTDFSVEVNGENMRFASEAARTEFERFRTEEEARPPAEQIVKFNGGYHADQLPRLMSRVDWCVVPSTWWETFALVISEAWAFGRPVIASDVGAMAERVRHETDGLLFPMGDARALAETMRRAATEEGLWQKLTGSLPKPPTRAAMVDAFLGLYRGGLDSPALSPRR